MSFYTDMIRERARRSNIGEANLALEPENEENQKFLVTVLIQGAVDDEFYLGDTIYEVNVADWIAENLQGLGELNSDVEDWEVLVTVDNFGAGETHYRISSED